jgi:hypothetical protein
MGFARRVWRGVVGCLKGPMDLRSPDEPGRPREVAALRMRAAFSVGNGGHRHEGLDQFLAVAREERLVLGPGDSDSLPLTLSP